MGGLVLRGPIPSPMLATPMSPPHVSFAALRMPGLLLGLRAIGDLAGEHVFAPGKYEWVTRLEYNLPVTTCSGFATCGWVRAILESKGEIDLLP